MKTTIIFIFLIALMSCSTGPEKTELIKMAKAGRINEEAPVKAEASIMIKAPVNIVWMRLTKMDVWPKWNKAISEVRIRGRLKENKKFVWIAGDTEISSEIAVYKPLKSLAWVSETSRAKAIQIWRLDAVDDFNTIVLVKESRDGFLLNWFYSSDDLHDFLNNWLNDMNKSLGNSTAVDQ